MKEEKAERRRKKRRERGSSSPRGVRVKEERGSSSPRGARIKEESQSPTRPGYCGGGSPPGPAQHGSRQRRRSRSPSKRKNKSSTRSQSPRNKRDTNGSPSPMMVQVKQERNDYHRAQEDRPHRDRFEQEHRHHRHRDQPHRDRNPNHWPEDRDDDRDGQNLRQQRADREFYNERRRENRHRKEIVSNDAHQEADQAGEEGKDKDGQNKEQPNFGLSGALLEDANMFRGVVIKYSEPPESRIPKKRWRLYPFKNDDVLPVMYIHRQSAYLLGRHRKIADIPIDHPSCSKQHAVLQYRLVEFTRANGQVGRRVRPYIIDLGSGNGTFLNNQKIEPQRYYELKEKDVLKFGFSSREYVVLHESSDTSEVDKNPNADDDEEDEGVEEINDNEDESKGS
ncbi:smad nuclear-interacting protein 1 [Ambystoma mexicanum]|uniref:smad nuclear-interacting protein 1 n=1 Tax=Ambystoma mexicanum TaxID=8296 RepID=UPI0037E99BD4